MIALSFTTTTERPTALKSFIIPTIRVFKLSYLLYNSFSEKHDKQRNDKNTVKTNLILMSVS